MDLNKKKCRALSCSHRPRTPAMASQSQPLYSQNVQGSVSSASIERAGERGRHDNIAYLINLSLIHVSLLQAVYANIVKHLNSWENWMQMVSMEAIRSVNTNKQTNCFCFHRVLHSSVSEAWFQIARHSGSSVGWSHVVSWVPTQQSKPKTFRRTKYETKNWTDLMASLRCDGKQNISKQTLFASRLAISANNRLRPLLLLHYANRNFLLSFRWHAALTENSKRVFRIVKHHSILINIYSHAPLALCSVIPASIPLGCRYRIQHSNRKQCTVFFLLTVCSCRFFFQRFETTFFMWTFLNHFFFAASVRRSVQVKEWIFIYWGNKFHSLRLVWDAAIHLLFSLCKYYCEIVLSLSFSFTLSLTHSLWRSDSNCILCILDFVH